MEIWLSISEHDDAVVKLVKFLQSDEVEYIIEYYPADPLNFDEYEHGLLIYFCTGLFECSLYVPEIFVDPVGAGAW